MPVETAERRLSQAVRPSKIPFRRSGFSRELFRIP
jgi:hypothetical protein